MIDIIVPVYNTPLNDLKRCLDSILNQSYKDYKVYIIDDGSNKETKEFLSNYKNNNIIIKHINNNGVSNARNIGIEISNSKYITFVDADDTIEENFLLEALELIENNNLDLIIGGYNEIKDNKIRRTRLPLPGLHIYGKDNIINFLLKLISSKTNETNKEIADCPTGRIYTRLFRRNSLNSLKFNTKIHISEDTLFMIDYTYQVNRIGIVDKVWYNYYINDYSITHNHQDDKIKTYIEELLKVLEKRKNNEPKNSIKEAYQIRIDKARNML